ncbi:bisanhydrobacterioruberin hydratase [Halocalculus aciditolerans]|uniref:Carotenoid biosynthesis protein n=1 Tax=Halocalculus aciditolerans TaxID=1383812 RepID=A0A830F137_9EURY|nr:bisanhydrobacterioruberin hydratase [Halocalculus aciditolerans]GGL51009.1 hypothetical protein GCM10009039_06580 [Halocalculus aciditolerans]
MSALDSPILTRPALERRLDALVDANRFTIAVVFPLVGGITLYASARGWLPPALAFNPLLVLFGTFVMRLPLVGGLLPLIGRRELTGLALLTAFTYLVELVGVATGLPYGNFTYLVHLGPMLFGLVPLGLPVFFLPLVLNSYLLVCLFLDVDRRFLRVALSTLTVVSLDLVLDPGAVALGFWAYDSGGVFYGVPLSNYLGWVFSGTVAVLCIEYAFDAEELTARLAACPYCLDDMVSFVLLWGGLNAAFENWLPALLAGLLGVALYAAGRFDIPRPRWR